VTLVEGQDVADAVARGEDHDRRVGPVEGPRINEWGLREYLVLNGTARVTEGGAPELLQRLAYTYLGPGVQFPAMPNPPPGWVVRVRVDRVSGLGPWA
jgi:hypothetical protein